MRALHKSKRVSWPPDFKLCQVRLFLSEESPSQVGSGGQDHLQAKSPWPSNPSDDNLPPGFGGARSAYQSQIKVSDIPVIKWKCSVRILLDTDWRVVTGDESEEVKTQNQREMRVLEAFYPGASAIPPNPSVSSDVENPHNDYQQTPIIPILPIEDDDTMMDAASDFSNQFDPAVGKQQSDANENASPGAALALGPDIMAAASAALSAISKSKEQGNMIDQDLLIKILSNPKLVENLVASYGAGSASSNAANAHQPPPVTFPAPSSTHEANGAETVNPTNSNGHFYPQPNGTHVSPAGFPPAPQNQPNFGASQVRDANYYKNLIHQHGGEKQEPPVQHLGYRYNHQPGGGANQETVNNNNQRPRDSKPKIMKPCIYFNSSRGCRHGANCAYQHDAAAYQPRNQNNGNNNTLESQSNKRMKFDRELGS